MSVESQNCRYIARMSRMLLETHQHPTIPRLRQVTSFAGRPDHSARRRIVCRIVRYLIQTRPKASLT